MKLSELKEEVEKDLIILKDRLDHESTRTPMLHNKYLKELIASKDQLMRYEYEYSTLYKDKWLYYQSKADPEVYKEKPLDLKIMKVDLAIFLDGDKELQAKKYQVGAIKQKIEFIDKTLQEINRRSFHISNTIRSLKWYHGQLDD